MSNKNSKIIIGIETSCDDTGIAILNASENKDKTSIKVLANEISSQIELHRQYGGVFPAMAKREHSKNIVPLFICALEKAKLLKPIKKSNKKIYNLKKLKKVLEREPEIYSSLEIFLTKYELPNIDKIVVTTGPGLEPTLWVGINFARAIGIILDLPVFPVNHMEGHVLSFLIPENISKSFKFDVKKLSFPLLALLVSGGHTEIVLAKEIGKYKVIGSTRDDAAGEAFDKIARMLDLPYPGGPEISKLAEEVRKNPKLQGNFNVSLPRPMINSNNFDFSFSGLKTSVLYFIRDMKNKPSDNQKKLIAFESENAIIDVLVSKTIKAVKKFKVNSIVVGGGVAANKHLRHELSSKAQLINNNISVEFPTKLLSTDNALMIALTGYLKYKQIKKFPSALKAEGNLKLRN